MEPVQGPSLKQRFFETCRRMGRAYKTAEAYWGWNVKYIRWHHQRAGGRDSDWPKVEPSRMGRQQIEEFLSYLANGRDVAPSTQNQAFSAILFLYTNVLKIEIKGVNALRATRPTYIPSVLSANETTALLKCLTGRNRLIAYLCYGAGMRIGEVFELRVKDIDFDNRFIHIRQAKGHKDRIVQLPEVALPLLRMQIAETERRHQLDTSAGRARVPLPYALARKSPRAAGELGWYWVFASAKYLDATNNDRGYVGRWHLDSTTFTKPLADAVRAAKILKRVTSHTLRHSFATHLMNNRVPLREIQELMGHSSIETTQIYLHVEQGGAASNRSPLDTLLATNTLRHHAG